MKKTTLFFSLIAGLTLFASCTKSAKPIDATGEWRFFTESGDYGELWINDKSLLTIREPERKLTIFDYRKNGDTIIFLPPNEKEEVNRMVLDSRKGDTLHIIQQGHKNHLILLEKEVPENFSNDQEFMESARNTFIERSPQK